MQNIDCEMMKVVIRIPDWDLSNEILYKMCREYPNHESDKEIIAKILIIGRVYSAAIERRKRVENNSDMFYIKDVAPTIRKSKIDEWLHTLTGLECPTRENCVQIIYAHKKVTDLLKKYLDLKNDLLPQNIYIFIFQNYFSFMMLALQAP